MFWLNYYNILFILLHYYTSCAQWSSPFDIRIDHYKTDIVRDLIINTLRPRFSWKVPISNDISQRNIQRTAYQLQLESTTASYQYNLLEWDSGRIDSSQSTHVPYTGQADLMPATNHRFRLRICTTTSKEPSEWTNWIRFRTPIFNLHEDLKNNADILWIGSTQINMNELRKEFSVPSTSPIHSAIVDISGIGHYQLYVNGYNVDPSRKLDPGWTQYEIRILLASFDVTVNITVGIVF